MANDISKKNTYHKEQNYMYFFVKLVLLTLADIFIKNVIRQKYFDSFLSKDGCYTTLFTIVF